MMTIYEGLLNELGLFNGGWNKKVHRKMCMNDKFHFEMFAILISENTMFLKLCRASIK